MNNLFSLNLLSQDFYNDYPHSFYPEMESKQSRPFLVFIIKIDDHKFAIPFRTNIKHSYCYKFNNTSRNTNSSTGLDFSKVVLVDNIKYIGPKANIDKKEFIELSSKVRFIKSKFENFYNKYKRIMLNPSNYPIEYFSLKSYSTLKYYHHELNIIENEIFFTFEYSIESNCYKIEKYEISF